MKTWMLSFGLAFGLGACGGSTSGAGDHDASVAFDTGVDALAHDAGGADAAADAPDDSPVADSASPCKQAATGNACVTCCATTFPGGKSELDLVGFNCMCNSCSTACKASTCQANAPPQSPCIACVKQSLAQDCQVDGGGIPQCSTSCQEYAACITQCAD